MHPVLGHLLHVILTGVLLSELTEQEFEPFIKETKYTHVFIPACIPQACFASLVSQDYVNGTDQEEIRTGTQAPIYSLWNKQAVVFYLMSHVMFSDLYIDVWSIWLSIAGVDQCIQKFLDVARQTECFFLQKRLQLSVQKPEQVVKEVNESLKLSSILEFWFEKSLRCTFLLKCSADFGDHTFYENIMCVVFQLQ